MVNLDVDWCELCAGNGEKKKLLRFQINFDEALTLCENPKCTYPMGLKSSHNILLKRQATDLDNRKQKRQKRCPSTSSSSSSQSTMLEMNSIFCKDTRAKCLVPAARPATPCEQQFIPLCNLNNAPSETGQCRNETSTPYNADRSKNSNSVSKILPAEFNINGKIIDLVDNKTICQNAEDPVKHSNILTGTDSVRVGSAFQPYVSSGNLLDKPFNTCDSKVIDLGKAFNSEEPKCKVDGNMRKHGTSHQFLNHQKEKHSTKTSSVIVTNHSNRTISLVKMSKTPLVQENYCINKAELNFPQWQNADALCWLDVSMCLLVHNENLKETQISSCTSKTTVQLLSSVYADALRLVNPVLHDEKLRKVYLDKRHVSIKTGGGQVSGEDLTGHEAVGTGDIDINFAPDMQLDDATKMLFDIREKLFKFLTPLLKCERGRNDSPYFALESLIEESKDTTDHFQLQYDWVICCDKCGHKQSDRYTQSLPSFPQVEADFSMNSPYFLRNCFKCGDMKQKRRMMFDSLPSSLLVHFTDGLPMNDLAKLDFTHSGSNYLVTGIIQHTTNPDHFVAWIRDPMGNKWMKCDDMQSVLCKYGDVQPSLPGSQVHIVMWEKRSQINGKSATINFNVLPDRTNVSLLCDGEVQTQNLIPLNVPVKIAGQDSQKLNSKSQLMVLGILQNGNLQPIQLHQVQIHNKVPIGASSLNVRSPNIVSKANLEISDKISTSQSSKATAAHLPNLSKKCQSQRSNSSVKNRLRDKKAFFQSMRRNSSGTPSIPHTASAHMSPLFMSSSLRKTPDSGVGRSSSLSNGPIFNKSVITKKVTVLQSSQNLENFPSIPAVGSSRKNHYKSALGGQVMFEGYKGKKLCNVSPDRSLLHNNTKTVSFMDLGSCSRESSPFVQTSLSQSRSKGMIKVVRTTVPRNNESTQFSLCSQNSSVTSQSFKSDDCTNISNIKRYNKKANSSFGATVNMDTDMASTNTTMKTGNLVDVAPSVDVLDQLYKALDIPNEIKSESSYSGNDVTDDFIAHLFSDSKVIDANIGDVHLDEVVNASVV